MQNLTFTSGLSAMGAQTIPTTDELITRLYGDDACPPLQGAGPRALTITQGDVSLTLQWSPDLPEVSVLREDLSLSAWEGPMSETQARAWLERQLRPKQTWTPRRAMSMI